MNLRSLVLLLLLPYFCLCILPGVKTTLTQRGLTYAKDVGLEILTEKLGQLHIPDQSGQSKIPPLGDLSWGVTDLNLVDVSLPVSDVKIIPSTGLSLAVSGIKINLAFNWSYKLVGLLNLSDAGTGNIAINESTISAQIKIFQSNGKPQLQVLSDTVAFGNFNIYISGGQSLAAVLVELLEGFLEEVIVQQLEKAITDNINNGLNKVLATLPFTVKISPTTEIDYSLTDELVLDPNFVSLPIQGEFYQIGNHQECPAPRSPTPNSDGDNMLQIFVTDFTPDSAGFVYWKLGQLSAKITDKDLPSWSPIRLNTSSFEYVLPSLYKTFPNADLVLQLDAEASPQALFTTSGATVAAYGFLTMYAVVDQKLVPAFILNGTISLSATASLKDETLYANLTLLSIDFGLMESFIGDFSVSLLDLLMNLLFSSGVVPAVNDILLASGFPLPVVKGIKFIDPTLQWGDQYLFISTDVQYTGGF